MRSTPAFTAPRPGAAAARWRGPLVLAPLVVTLHAAVLFSAWQVVDRQPAVPTDAAGAADATTLQPREVRLVAQPLSARAVPAGGPATAATAATDVPDAPEANAPALVSVPVSMPLPAPVPAADARATPPFTAQRQDPPPGAAGDPPTPPPAAAAREPETAAALVQAAAASRATDVAATKPPAPTGATAASGTLPSSPGAPPPETVMAAAAPALAADLAPLVALGPTPTPGTTPTAAEAPAARAAATARPEAAAAASTPSLPVYRGEAPPSATLHFTLSRAAISGRGKLSWTNNAQGYELTLQGTVLGMRLLEQTSRGRFDQGSLAPDRFLDARRGRAARAANFRRDVGLISYSAVEQTYPLARGAQDRLSWMLQLPAVMQANPALRELGTELYMFVTGARGDGDVWGFRVLSVDRRSVPAGEVPRALHLQRLPRYEHDTQADIWLDPGRHHLPARVRLQSGDDVLDLVLERVDGG